MLSTTFLGHQGWLFRTERVALLVDPLLCDTFATYGGVTRGYEVYPPRDLDFAAFPKLDAVMLSHEHEDHFDLPSLNRLDRKIPIYLSCRSSTAARTVLGNMGFTVTLLRPSSEVILGGDGGGDNNSNNNLALMPMTPDHVNNNTEDELDVMPFFVRDLGGHGNFFTSIDVPETETMWRLMRAKVKSPGLWTYTQNAGNWSFQNSWVRPNARGTEQFAQRVLSSSEKLRRFWGAPPCASLFCGGGTTFGSPLEFLNQNAYHVNLEQAANALTLMMPDLPFVAALPGATFVMKDGKLVTTTPTPTTLESPFLRAKPRSEWRPRDYVGDVRAVAKYPTVLSGGTAFRREDGDDLRAFLNELAQFIFGTELFRSIYSLRDEDTAPRRSTFALVLLADESGGAIVLEYSPEACAFIPSQSPAPMRDYFAGFECWASDLVALSRGAFAPSNLMYGHCRAWCSVPDLVDFDFGYLLRRFLHPLRRPKLQLDLYERIRASLPVLSEKERISAANHTASSNTSAAITPDFNPQSGR